MRIFGAISALCGWVSIGVNAVNAISQSSTPEEPTLVLVDAQMREWLKEQRGIHVDEGDVSPVQCALQGHPESGSIWADKVESYLKNDLNFKYPFHEPCLYISTYEGGITIIGRQLDDFKAADLQEDNQQSLFAFLKPKINVAAEVGLMYHYNGIGIVQAWDYVKKYVETYINKIIKVHVWETASPMEDCLVEPIYPSVVQELEETDPLPETKAESVTNEKAA
jgi:hypothetical protein